MNNGLKIFLGIVIFLGLISGVFLMFAKKNTTPAVVNKTIQATAQVKSLNPSATVPKALPPKDSTIQKPEAPKADTSKTAIKELKTVTQGQWIKCKDKTADTKKALMWNVQITEAIPPKGTYAKGNLDGSADFPVHVIIKSDSTLASKIKGMLVVGKSAFLRGTCTDVAADGSVVLQVY
jgi:hypothetical protein